jgi:uncharacterized protein YfaQ (DUF2300 family)
MRGQRSWWKTLSVNGPMIWVAKHDELRDGAALAYRAYSEIAQRLPRVQAGARSARAWLFHAGDWPNECLIR